MKFSSWNRRTVAWIGGLFIAAIVALAGFDIVANYHASVANTGRELDAHGRLIAEQTARTLQAVDVVLRHLAQQHRQGVFDGMKPRDLHNYLREQAVGLVQVEGLGIILPDGNPRAISLAHPPPFPINVANMEIFQALRAGHRGLFIGDAVKGPDERWVLPLGRRIDTPAGGFAGAAAARGRIEYFEQFYRNVQLDPATSVSLMRQNGVLLVRHPRVEAALGKRLPLFDEMLRISGPMRNVSPVDGVERFAVLKLVPDYPLAVVVTRDVASALAPWRAQSIGTALRTLALSALAAALLAILLWQLARLQTTQERYALAVAGSDDGVWDYDFVNQRVFASARAREISGLPPGPEIQSIDEWNAQLKIHPEDAPRRRAAQEAHLRGDTPTYEGEWRMLHPDGEYRWIRIHGLCLRDASGKPYRMAGSTSDIDVRKRAEEALRVSEEQYRAIFNSAADALILRDADARIIDVNPAFVEMSGYSREEVLGKTRWIFTPPEMAQTAEALHARAIGGELTQFEVPGRRKDGSRLDIEFRLVPTLHQGKAHYLAIARDITARKRAEEALRLSEERYALAVAGSDDGVWDFDFANRKVFASARARELCGLPPGPEVQPMDEWFAGLPIHPDDAARRVEAMEAHMAGKTPAYEGEFRMRHADGKYRWVRIHGLCIRDAAGNPHRMAGSIGDIDELKASEEQYRSIFNAAADALVLRDAEACVVDVNPAFLQISGFTREEVVGKKRWIFAGPEQSALAAEMHRRVIAGESVQAEIQAQRKDGSPIEVEMRAVPIRYRGQPHALGMARDITAQKRAAAERTRLEGQLLQAKKLEAIGTLAGGIAHDFNNILAAILGYGDMAQRKATDGTPLRRHIDAVVAAGLRAKSLVERILAFSRSGVGERTPVHVESVVAEALDLFGASLPQHVQLERRLSAGDATVMGDATQIHQVVMNLCANAVQAMKSKGRLTVSLDVVERGETMAATSRLAAGRYLRLVVRDTGSGIAPHLLERIFDPFFTTREVGVGTGLGLSLVHGIVTELGGGIDVDSKPGDGTAFTVYLPWSSAQALPATGAEDVPLGEGETVLLVDDEDALVRLGEEMLAELGYEPVGFTSSVEALKAFRESPERFQAVLSDEAMADMTGAELAKAIRAIRPDIPVVLMSGYASPLFTARARNIGVVEVLTKPLVARDIARSLAAALRENKERIQ